MVPGRHFFTMPAGRFVFRNNRLSVVTIAPHSAGEQRGTISIMRRIAASTLILINLAGGAYADQCQDDVAKIDEALAGSEIKADVRAQLEDMRSQAVQLCGAGNIEEGTAVTAEALALIEAK